MSILRVITTNTPVGDFHMIVDEQDIVRASGFGSTEDLTHRLPEAIRSHEIVAIDNHPYGLHVKSYFAGDKNALQRINYEQDGREFQCQVWQAIAQVDHGQTISYKQLAEAAGNAPAIRAAGTICGLNRLILLVPCHRILKSDGGIGSYLYGSDIKEFLLKHEGALAG